MSIVYAHYATLGIRARNCCAINIGAYTAKVLMDGWKSVDIKRKENYLVLSKGGEFRIIGRDYTHPRTQINVTKLVRHGGLIPETYFDGSYYKVKRTKDGKVIICLNEKIE